MTGWTIFWFWVSGVFLIIAFTIAIMPPETWAMIMEALFS